MANTVLMSTSIPGLSKIAEGKVRDLYEVDKHTLLFVASDRISAYDVIMKNVSIFTRFDFQDPTKSFTRAFLPREPS